jgi:hypothetical protein
MAGLVPATTSFGRQYFRRLSRLGQAPAQMAANLPHFSSWTTWMAWTSPAMTAPRADDAGTRLPALLKPALLK